MKMQRQMRHACRAFLVVTLGARAESATSTPFDGAEAPWARASRQLFLGATSPPPPSRCMDARVFASEDDGNDCDDDDVAPGSEFPMCTYCTDCVDYCPRVPRAPPPPLAGTPSGPGSPDAKYPNGQLVTDCVDYGPGQQLAASPAPLRAGTGICTLTYDADFDDGPGSEFSMCAYGNDYVDCDGRTASPPPPPHSLGMVCTNNCLNAGGNSRNDGGGAGSEFATCAYCTDSVDCGPRVSMPSSPPRPPAAHPAHSPPPSICSNLCFTSNADYDDGGPGSECLFCAARAVASTIHAVASTSSAAGFGNIHAFMGNVNAVSIPRTIVRGANRQHRERRQSWAPTTPSWAPTALSRAPTAEHIPRHHEHHERRRERKSRRREHFTSPAPSLCPPKTPPCRLDCGLTSAPGLAHVLDVVRAVHVHLCQVLVQPWQLGASLDDQEGGHKAGAITSLIKGRRLPARRGRPPALWGNEKAWTEGPNLKKEPNATFAASGVSVGGILKISSNCGKV